MPFRVDRSAFCSALWAREARHSSVVKVAIAVVAGLVVFALLFHWGGGQDSDPPTCFGMFGYTVPCDAWMSWAAGAAMAAVVFLALWLKHRRR